MIGKRSYEQPLLPSDLSRRPVALARTGGGAAVGIGTIIDGELLASSSRGCRYYSGSLIDDGGVSDEWDPEATIGTQDYQPGIAAAQLWGSGAKVLIFNDARFTMSPIDVFDATPIAVRLSEAVTFAVIDADPAASVIAYPFRLL